MIYSLLNYHSSGYLLWSAGITGWDISWDYSYELMMLENVWVVNSALRCTNVSLGVYGGAGNTVQHSAIYL